MEMEKDQNLEMIEGYAGKLMFEADRNEFVAFCLDIMAGLVEEGDVITMIKSFDRLRRPILNNGFQRV